MMESNISLPIQICSPRCYVIEPAINRFQAITRAGSQGDKTFRLTKFLRRGSSVNVKLIQRRLVPFWSVRCRSRFHYDKSSSYVVNINDQDAVEVTLHSADEKKIVLPVNPQSKNRSLTVHGKERCVTERDVSELIDAYQLPETKSILRNPLSFKDDQATFREYLANPTAQVNDLAMLYQTNTIDGRPVYSDVEDESIQIILPNEPANRVVGEVMKKVMVSIDPITIYDWSLAVEVADLYFRPLYVFEFERLDKEKVVVETKLEQLDAINGSWSTISTREVTQPGRVPWDKIMHLTIDASIVVLQELGGPWVKVTTGLIGVTVDHVPGIVDDMKGSEIEEN